MYKHDVHLCIACGHYLSFAVYVKKFSSGMADIFIYNKMLTNLLLLFITEQQLQDTYHGGSSRGEDLFILFCADQGDAAGRCRAETEIVGYRQGNGVHPDLGEGMLRAYFRGRPAITKTPLIAAD